MLGAAGAGSLLLGPGSAQAATKVKSSARIVIAGAGAAGLAAASYLANRLDGAQIMLIDARKEHFYQPGFTLVAAGIKQSSYVVSTTREYVPGGVELVEERVVEFDPEGNKVVTESGKPYPYDFLVVATGLKLDYDAIPGMDTEQIGNNGLGSIYHSPAKAEATWRAMSEFADKGGVGVFLRPGTEMKCAGAPLKYTFITDDHLRRRGNRGKAELIYNANNKALFSVPIVHEKVRMLFDERGVKVNYERILESIDLGKKLAVFKTPIGPVELQYDFINVIPPMRAADSVRNSPLRWQEGGWANDGWIEVDKHSLRHKRFDNVFAVGDVAGVP
jgi:sulfide:quinone oxidoreductase